MSKAQKFSTVFTAAVCAVCLFVLASATLAFARAEGGDSIRALLVKPTTATEYFHIDGAYSLSAFDGKIRVDCFNGSAHVFEASGAYCETVAGDGQAAKTVVCGGKFFRLCGGTLLSPDGSPIAENVADVAAGGDAIYALTADKILRFGDFADGQETFDSVEYSLAEGIAPKLIAAFENEVFFAAAVNGAYGNDIYRTAFLPSDGSFSDAKKAYSRVAEIYSLVSPAAGVVIAAHPGESSRYEMKNGVMMRTSSVSERDVRALCAAPDEIYMLTGEGAIVAYTHGLGGRKEVVASASGQLGFYRAPRGIFTRRNAIYVADTLNDRIVKLSDDGAVEVDYAFTEPVAVVSDYVGNIFVAHNADAVEVFDADFKHLKTLRMNGEVVVDLKSDAADNLYAATASRKLYRLAAGSEEAELIAESGVDAIAVQPNSESEIFALDTALGVVRKISDVAPQRIFEFTRSVVSFTVDVADNFYLLDEGGAIVKYFAENGYDESKAVSRAYESGFEVGAGASFIALSAIKNSLVSYGDIIICEPLRNCVKKIPAEAFGVNVTDDGFIPPPVTGDNANTAVSPDDDANRIVRLALSDTEIYEKPIETAAVVCSAQSGQRVIVVNYRDVGPFARILIDDKISSKLIAGYVYRTRLSEALPYSEPAAEWATIYSGSTDIYKYPSRKAPILSGYEGVKKGDKFKLLDFVKDFADSKDTAKKWYRIELAGGTEGYILSHEVSVGYYDPIFEYPKVNATIISVGGSFAAPLYFKTDGGKQEIIADKDLPTGTRVEVVEEFFDASEQYTLIKYLDPENGTLTAYVETKYLKYDGVGIMPVVIAAVALVVISGIIVFFVWHRVAKNRKLTKA